MEFRRKQCLDNWALDRRPLVRRSPPGSARCLQPGRIDGRTARKLSRRVRIDGDPGTIARPDEFATSTRRARRVKRNAFIRELEQAGCEFVRHGGRHDLYRNPSASLQAPVPRHREIAKSLCKVIRRQKVLNGNRIESLGSGGRRSHPFRSRRFDTVASRCRVSRKSSVHELLVRSRRIGASGNCHPFNGTSGYNSNHQLARRATASQSVYFDLHQLFRRTAESKTLGRRVFRFSTLTNDIAISTKGELPSGIQSSQIDEIQGLI